ncbi:MAG: hypothetical protein CVV19_00555 [Gammaproteobacteria bacterium HGW-Gammaproteobacteria-9]|nr:MAG: hypothetical protein CVV19_00555 [Gammaproteobacteria bacterium HGW-Gammaproteobacteria-9]
MSKVLVDRELLLQLFRCWDCGLEVDNELAQLRIAAAQPAEAEGGIDLKPILEDVEREYEMGGLSDGLYADYASDVAKRYASAALSAVTAERDRLLDAAGKAIAWLDAEQNESGVGINRRLKLCRDAENSLRAAMAAKEAEPEHVCSGCGAKAWTGNCLDCIPY